MILSLFLDTRYSLKSVTRENFASFVVLFSSVVDFMADYTRYSNEQRVKRVIIGS